MSYPTLFTTPGVRAFAEEIDAERQRQLQKFGEQHHPDMVGDPGTQCDRRGSFAERAAYYREVNSSENTLDWTGILLEEVYEAVAEADPAKIRAELLQVAAVCQAWVHDLDSRTGAAPKPAAEACAKCRQPFDPRDLAFDGHARHGGTPFCRRCVDRCHESTDAFHRCAICQ